MNKKYVILVLAIIGMGVLYKRSLQTMQQEAAPAEASGEEITFITSDGQRFSFARDAAMKLEFVRLALGQDSTLFEPSTIFPLERITAADLAPLLSVINNLSNTPNLDNSVIQKLKDLSLDQLRDLFLAASLLDNELAHSIARLFIFKQLQDDDLSPAILPGTNFKQDLEIVTNSAGFKAFNKPINDQELDLSNTNITNVYGLLLVPNINAVRRLRMQGARITLIPTDAFNCLTTLEELDFSYGIIKEISDGAFHGLTRLKTLSLGYNRINKISAPIFDGLDNIEELYLTNNEISIIPRDTFSSLAHLRLLDLKRNIPPLVAEQVKKQYFPVNSQITIIAG